MARTLTNYQKGEVLALGTELVTIINNINYPGGLRDKLKHPYTEHISAEDWTTLLELNRQIFNKLGDPETEPLKASCLEGIEGWELDCTDKAIKSLIKEYWVGPFYLETLVVLTKMGFIPYLKGNYVDFCVFIINHLNYKGAIL